MVRAKFKVTNVEDLEGRDGQHHGSRISLHPVYDGSEENKQFYQYTPGGLIVLETVNPSAAAQFEQGVEYYVDFTRAGETEIELPEEGAEVFAGGSTRDPVSAET